MSHLRLEQPSLFQDNPQPSQPIEGNIISGIHPHSPTSSQVKLCQYSWVGTAQFQLLNAMPLWYFRHLWGTGDQPNKNPGALCKCVVDIFSNVTNCEIQRQGMLTTWKIGQVSPGGCRNDLHNSHCSRKLTLNVPPPIACVHLTVYSPTVAVCVAHWFEMEVCLTWHMCQKRLYIFKHIPVL